MTNLERYFELIEKADTVEEHRSGEPVVRLAVLGDHATQRICCCLRACFSESGFYMESYEGSFHSIELEVRSRELEKFAPQFAYLAICVQSIRDVYFSMNLTARTDFSRSFGQQLEAQVDALRRLGCSVIVNTLAISHERQFGNYSASTEQSFLSTVLEINRQISRLAKETPLLVVDVMYLAALVGSNQFLDERFWTLSRLMCPNEYLPIIAENVVAVVSSALGKLTKCLVLDLDNTLWAGEIGDDGLEGIRLGERGEGELHLRFQQYLLGLRDRGYLLAICSKNDDVVARSPFREHPGMPIKESDVSVFLANWSPKAENVQRIAQTLNIGLESLIVIDDSPFEREQIRGTLPQVVVPEMPQEVAEWIPYLETQHLFEVAGFTATDRNRAKLYSEEELRKRELAKYSSIDEYLASLGMKLWLKRIEAKDLERFCQLLTRTNQFNLRTQRLQASACKQLLAQPERHLLLGVRLADRFGDYGMIGAVHAEMQDENLFIAEFALSCRAFKRGVEYALINWLVSHAKSSGQARVLAEYLPTQKNSLVRDLYDSAGFSRVREDSDGSRQYTLDVNSNLNHTFVGEVHFDQ